jgi:hypothetical protein
MIDVFMAVTAPRHHCAMEKMPMRSVKVWAYRELSGNKYFEVLLAGGTSVRIDFIEGLTTQQSFAALGRALDEKLGSCCITAMNKLALFDESDELSEEQKRELFKSIGNPLNVRSGAWPSEYRSHNRVGGNTAACSSSVTDRADLTTLARSDVHTDRAILSSLVKNWPAFPQ